MSRPDYSMPFQQGLKGIRVLDFTWAAAGPYATELLAQMGADVVKVEASSKPDLLRVANIAYNWGPGGLDSNACFNDMNAGKRSISIDLKSPAGQELALDLARKADVVIDNMRPGKMEALGLGYDQLRTINPGVICCSMSATGRVTMPDGTAGPDVPGYAPVFWAEGGGASVTGFKDEEPAYFRAPTDVNAATFFAVGILSALIARDRSGEGCRIDCSAVETVAACVGDEVLAASLGLPAGGLRGNDRPPSAPSDTFPCVGDDTWIAISAETTDQWRTLCDVLSLSALANDPALDSRLERWNQRDRLYGLIADATQRRDGAELEAELWRAGVPASVCWSFPQLLADPALHERGFWRTIKHPLIGDQVVGGLAFRVSPPIEQSDRGGPLLGEHTCEVLSDWLGMEIGEIKSLEQRGAFEAYEIPT